MVIYRIMYGLTWITFFCHDRGRSHHSSLIFMSDTVTGENHWQITSQVIKNHYPCKAIYYFISYMWGTGYCDVLFVNCSCMHKLASVPNCCQSVCPKQTNLEGDLEFFLKIFFNFMFMIWDSRQRDWQFFWLSFEHWIGAQLIFTNEYQLCISHFLPTDVHGVACKKCVMHLQTLGAVQL